MKAILILVVGITFLCSVQNPGMHSYQAAGQTTQRTAAQQEAWHELNEAARSYSEGNFAEAQFHSEKALALDPLSKTAPYFIARTIHAQYKPGDQNEANVAKAREAIDAYKRILARELQSEEAYKAVVDLYRAVKEDELLRQLVFQRAVDPNFSDEKRAEAFIVLASRDWDCSFKITELPTNHTTTILKNRSVKIHYTKPKDPAEFERAQQCAANGLTMIENAITLAPDSESAWSYKTNLLMELSKLAEMDNNLPLKTECERQREVARSMTEDLSNRRTKSQTTKP